MKLLDNSVKMFFDALLSTFWFIPLTVGLTIDQITWFAIKVPLPTPSAPILRASSFMGAARHCLPLQDCNLICKDGEDFVQSTQMLDLLECQDSHIDTLISCWTKQIRKFYNKLVGLIICS